MELVRRNIYEKEQQQIYIVKKTNEFNIQYNIPKLNTGSNNLHTENKQINQQNIIPLNYNNTKKAINN